MEALMQPSSPKPDQPRARYQADPRIRNGAARRRQIRRQRRRRWLGGLTRGFALVWLLAGAGLPLIMHTYSVTRAAPEASLTQNHAGMGKTSGSGKLSSLAISAGILSATPSPRPPTQTATATPFPTASPTPTALPPRLIQATAWQATLDSAAAFSHATQTQAAGQYAATQTALPPILTANALEREAGEP